MEKIKYLILIFCLFLAACDSDDNKTDSSELEVISSDLSIAAVGGTGTIEVFSAGAWSATSNKTWCTVTVSGKIVHVTVPENPTISSRIALITIKAPEGNKTIPVSQQGSIIALSQPKLTLGASGKTKNVTVQSNLKWTASSKDRWCHIYITDDTLKVSADHYDNTDPRTTQITLSAGKNTKILSVSQRNQGDFMLEKWSDTDLGATLPATEENMQNPNYQQTWGDMYQWGRNVTFSRDILPSVVMTNASITAQAAQTMTEFIGSELTPFDWLSDGSATTLPATGNSYVWKDRAGQEPCPDGWRLPLDYEARQIFPYGEIEGRYVVIDRCTNTEVLDAAGTSYTCVSVGDGNYTKYAIKKFGTENAYVMKYEWKTGPYNNGYLKVTEIRGDAYTDFTTSEEAEALFSASDEQATKIFPASGYLYCNTATATSLGVSCNYWTASPYKEYATYVSATNFQLHVDALYCPRSLGCQIRCIKAE
ncbi:BACON domain-containing protein [Culturomica massiliensis]|uniref:BACON domain-containing protein n=1 Tax=Culturomica massiliensis TaxID=1841857 RepID=UPI001878A3B4|nr:MULTISPECIES: BACON domain-containing protein [Odoribacteraceae]